MTPPSRTLDICRLKEGVYYWWNDCLWVGKVCTMCPTNSHRVRQRCFESVGRARGMLVRVIPPSPSSSTTRFDSLTSSNTQFECLFNLRYSWYGDTELPRPATDEEVNEWVIEHTL